MPKLMFGRVFNGGVYTGQGLCTIWNYSYPSSWRWSDTQVNVSRQWLKVNQRCFLSWVLESRKKWKLLSPALPYAKMLLTFMIFFPLPLLLSVFMPQGQWKNTADSRLLSEFPFADDGLPCQFKRHRINLFQWFLFRLNASLFFYLSPCSSEKIITIIIINP